MSSQTRHAPSSGQSMEASSSGASRSASASGLTVHCGAAGSSARSSATWSPALERRRELLPRLPGGAPGRLLRLRAAAASCGERPSMPSWWGLVPLLLGLPWRSSWGAWAWSSWPCAPPSCSRCTAWCSCCWVLPIYKGALLSALLPLPDDPAAPVAGERHRPAPAAHRRRHGGVNALQALGPAAAARGQHHPPAPDAALRRRGLQRPALADGAGHPGRRLRLLLPQELARAGHPGGLHHSHRGGGQLLPGGPHRDGSPCNYRARGGGRGDPYHRGILYLRVWPSGCSCSSRESCPRCHRAAKPGEPARGGHPPHDRSSWSAVAILGAQRLRLPLDGARGGDPAARRASTSFPMELGRLVHCPVLRRRSTRRPGAISAPRTTSSAPSCARTAATR